MLEMLIDIADQHPIRDTPAGLPAIVVEVAGRSEKRSIEYNSFKSDSRMRFKHLTRSVARGIVENEVAVDKRIVMPEEVGQHLLFIPAQGIKMEADVRHR